MSDLTNSPNIDQERLAKWRENTLPVELPEGFKRPTKLEWQMSSDGERWFANVADGQIVIDLVIGNEWRISWLSWKQGPLPMSMCGVRYVTIDEAKAAVQDWYNSTRKEQVSDDTN